MQFQRVYWNTESKRFVLLYLKNASRIPRQRLANGYSGYHARNFLFSCSLAILYLLSTTSALFCDVVLATFLILCFICGHPTRSNQLVKQIICHSTCFVKRLSGWFCLCRSLCRYLLAWFSDGPRSVALNPPWGTKSERPRTVWTSGYLSVCLSVCLSGRASQSVRPSVHLSVSLSLPVSPLVCPSICPSDNGDSTCETWRTFNLFRMSLIDSSSLNNRLMEHHWYQQWQPELLINSKRDSMSYEGWKSQRNLHTPGHTPPRVRGNAARWSTPQVTWSTTLGFARKLTCPKDALPFQKVLHLIADTWTSRL